MGLQNLTDMFSGSIIDYDTLLKNEQANRKQVGDAFAESMKALNNNYDIFNRKTKYNEVKNKLEDVNRYNEIKNGVVNDEKFIKDYEKRFGRKVVDKEGFTNELKDWTPEGKTKEEIKRVQGIIGAKQDGAFHKTKGKGESWGKLAEYNASHPDVEEESHIEVMPLSIRDRNKPATIADKDFGSKSWLRGTDEYLAQQGVRNKFKPATIADKEFEVEMPDEAKEYEKYLEHKNNIKVNSKYLEDNAENYNNLMRDYGWMLENPELTDTIAEEYIRTGDPSKFINMKNTWKQNQLEKQRLADERDSKRVSEARKDIMTIASNEYGKRLEEIDHKYKADPAEKVKAMKELITTLREEFGLTPAEVAEIEKNERDTRNILGKGINWSTGGKAAHDKAVEASNQADQAFVDAFKTAHGKK